MKTLIKGARVVDPESRLDGYQDIIIENGAIAGILDPGETGSAMDDMEIIDAGGLIAVPGLIDMHVHLREPGEEYKETIASGTAAAAAGGFTAVACMPNTKPVCDERSIIEFILRKASVAGKTKVYPVAAMTRGSRGLELSEYAELAEGGAVGVSDDGRWLSDPKMMRRALDYAKLMGLTAISHPEYHELSGGVMNESYTSTILGLAGIPNAAEEIAVFRDVKLAELTGSPVHLAHISTAGSVEIIRNAKKAGVPVTAETAPHYFTLTDQAVIGWNTNAKMNPPLRSESDVEAIRNGLADGTLDAIATDHAPHSVLEKDLEFDKASFGIVGLETALPLTLELVRLKIIDLSQAVEALSLKPAEILGVKGGMLKKGAPADITLIDPEKEWVVDKDSLRSKSGNTPFHGATMRGAAVLTMVNGKIVYKVN